MNIKHLLSLFAAGAFLFASCTEENEINGNTPIDGSSTDDTSGRKEVLLNIKNSLVLQKTGTKAAEEPIATEEENYIRTLDVYVFGAKKENDPYTLQEIHYYRDDASTVTLPGVDTYSFNLNNDADDSAITTGLLKLKKGLFVKLYWLSVNDYTIENKGQKVTTITGTITDATGMLATGKTDGGFTIKNKLDPTKTIKVEVITSVPVAATVSKSVNDTGLNALTSKEVTLYNAEGQSILLSTDILATLEAKSDAGFLRLSNGTNSEHKITLPTAQSLPLSATPKLVFTTGDGATTEITVALKSPAITALTTSDIQSTTGTNILTEATDASNTKVTITDATPKSKFTHSVKSQAGITIGETSSWLKVAAAPATGTPGDYTTVVTVSIVGGTNLTEAITNGKIVLTNNIPNGGDMTIDVETSVPTAIP